MKTIIFQTMINSPGSALAQAIFFGLGSDGTVGANKAAAAIIGERTEFYSQALVALNGFFWGLLGLSRDSCWVNHGVF